MSAPLVRLAALGFPELARSLALLPSPSFPYLARSPEVGAMAFMALNRMEASDRDRLPGSVPLIRARYAVARRLIRLILAETSAPSPTPVNPTPREEMVN